MVHIIADTHSDLHQLPPIMEGSPESITIGDLHGNTLKLFYFLLRHNVVGIHDTVNAQQLYTEFADFYEKSGELRDRYRELEGPAERVKNLTTAYKVVLERKTYLDSLHELSPAQEKELEVLNSNGSGSIAASRRILDSQAEILAGIQQKIDNISIQVDGKTEQLRIEDIPAHLAKFFSRIEVRNPKTLVRLIGDEMADRGSNDYFTLRFLHFLRKRQVPVHINISNHSNEFIKGYESDFKVMPKGAVEGKQMTSYLGLDVLVKRGIVGTRELKEYVEQSYLPCLKVIDYSLTPEGITLFTHAPVRFDKIKEIAQFLGVSYSDSTPEALAISINEINAKFHDYVKNKNIHEICPTGNLIDNPDIVKNNPLVHILWNRWTAADDTEDARPVSVNGFKVNYVHGHDEFRSLLSHIHNIDSSFGKLSRLDQEQAKEQLIQAEREGMKAEALEELKKKAFLEPYIALEIDHRPIRPAVDVRAKIEEAGLAFDELFQDFEFISSLTMPNSDKASPLFKVFSLINWIPGIYLSKKELDNKNNALEGNNNSNESQNILDRYAAIHQQFKQQASKQLLEITTTINPLKTSGANQYKYSEIARATTQVIDELFINHPFSNSLEEMEKNIHSLTEVANKLQLFFHMAANLMQNYDQSRAAGAKFTQYLTALMTIKEVQEVVSKKETTFEDKIHCVVNKIDAINAQLEAISKVSAYDVNFFNKHSSSSIVASYLTNISANATPTFTA